MRKSNWPTPVKPEDTDGWQVNKMICHKIKMLNKSSFGPSQEDEGRKKTAHTMEIFSLIQYRVCPIHGELLQNE